MSRFRDENPDCKVYVGDLSSQASKQDVEDAFSYYGPIKNVWVARNPPGFAFVEFEDIRDAEDAVKEVDGRRTVCGRRVRVERAGGKRGRGGGGYRSRPFRSGGGGGGRRGRPFHPEDRCFECGNKGHYARDCRGHKRNRYSRGRNSSYSRSGSRSRSRTRRSRSRNHRSRSRGDRRSRSRDRRSRSHSSSSRSSRRSKNNDKSRSRSISRNNNRRDRSASREKSRSKSLSKSRSTKVKEKSSEVINGDG